MSLAGADAELQRRGYLTKQGHRIKNWKRRYFCLEQGLLSYADDATPGAKTLGQVGPVADRGALSSAEGGVARTARAPSRAN